MRSPALGASAEQRASLRFGSIQADITITIGNTMNSSAGSCGTPMKSSPSSVLEARTHPRQEAMRNSYQAEQAHSSIERATTTTIGYDSGTPGSLLKGVIPDKSEDTSVENGIMAVVDVNAATFGKRTDLYIVGQTCCTMAPDTARATHII